MKSILNLSLLSIALVLIGYSKDSFAQSATDVELSLPIAINMDVDYEGQVFRAIDSCDPAALGEILSIGALDRSGAMDKSSYTPLMRAVKEVRFYRNYRCRDEIVDQLLDYGVDINEADGLGYTALHHAVINDSPVAIQTLLRQPGIDPNIQDKISGFTPLIWSVFMNYGGSVSLEPMFLLMSSKEVDMNATDDSGETALMHAARLRDVFVTGSYGSMYSIGRGPEIARLLLTRSDIDADQKDPSGFDAIDFAKMYNNDLVVDVILNHQEMKKKQAKRVAGDI